MSSLIRVRAADRPTRGRGGRRGRPATRASEPERPGGAADLGPLDHASQSQLLPPQADISTGHGGSGTARSLVCANAHPTRHGALPAVSCVPAGLLATGARSVDGPIWPTTRRRSQWWRRLSWWRRGRRHSWCEFSAIRATAFTQHRYATANRWWRLGVQSALHTRALGTGFTTEIEAEIAQLAAGWPDLISLGSGDPDLDTPAHIRGRSSH